MSKEKYVAIILIIASVLFFALSLKISNRTFAFGTNPKTIPLICTSIMVLFSMLYYFVEHPLIHGKTITWRSAVKILVTIASIALYAFAIESIGYLTGTILLTIVFSFVVGASNIFRIIVVSVALSISTWFVFAVLFSSYLPNGWF